MLYYVGETESISQRIKTHRSSPTYSGFVVSALVVRVAQGKSAARLLESTLIQGLKRGGLLIKNDKDESHRLFGIVPSNSKS